MAPSAAPSLSMLPALSGCQKKMFEDASLEPALRPLKDDLVGDVGSVLWVLMGTIVLALLIACANVANLLLVRVEGRQQEPAMRVALGANWAGSRQSFFRERELGVSAASSAWDRVGALRLLVFLAPRTCPGSRRSPRPGRARCSRWPLGAGRPAARPHPGLQVPQAPQVATPACAAADLLERGSRERHGAALLSGRPGRARPRPAGRDPGSWSGPFRALRDVHPGWRGRRKVLTLRISIPRRVRGGGGARRAHAAERSGRVAALPG